jgi:hypothetical protein
MTFDPVTQSEATIVTITCVRHAWIPRPSLASACSLARNTRHSPQTAPTPLFLTPTSATEAGSDRKRSTPPVGSRSFSEMPKRARPGGGRGCCLMLHSFSLQRGGLTSHGGKREPCRNCAQCCEHVE